MPVPRILGIACACVAITLCSTTVRAQASKDPSERKSVRCCGLVLRTEFGHPDRLAEMAFQPDTVLSNSIDSGKMSGLADAFEAYLGEVDKEFGDSAHRDVVRTRLFQVFKSVENDPARSKLLMAGFRQFSFASTLESKGLKERSIEEVRQSRTAFLKAVPADSFCLMPVDLYLATALTETGNAVEAVPIAQAVVTRAKAAFGKRDEFVGSSLVALGRAQLKSGKAVPAEQSLREGIGILSESLEIQPNSYFLNCSILAEALLEQSKYQETAELMGYLDPQIRKLFRDQIAPPVFNAAMMRGKALIELERFDEAEKVLGRYPEMVQSLKEPGVEGRNLLEVSVTLLEKTGRADQTVSAKKWITRFDAKLASANGK